jgi:hypothetical protein
MILVKCAVNGCHPLKCINLAAPLHVHTHSVFNIEWTMKTGALFENVKVWAISRPPHRPSTSPAFFISLPPKYNKKVILHN